MCRQPDFLGCEPAKSTNTMTSTTANAKTETKGKSSKLFALWKEAGGAPDAYPLVSESINPKIEEDLDSLGWDFSNESYAKLATRYQAILGDFEMGEVLSEKKALFREGRLKARNVAAQTNSLLLSLCAKKLTPLYVKRLEIQYFHCVPAEKLVEFIEACKSGEPTEPPLTKELAACLLEYERLCVRQETSQGELFNEHVSKSKAPSDGQGCSDSPGEKGVEIVRWNNRSSSVEQRRNDALAAFNKPLPSPEDQFVLALSNLSSVPRGRVAMGDFTSTLPLWVSSGQERKLNESGNSCVRISDYNGKRYLLFIKSTQVTKLTKGHFSGKVSKARHRYPGKTEHAVLRTLFRMASENSNSLLAGKTPQDNHEGGLFITFTYSLLRRELAKIGRSLKIERLKEALEVLRDCSIKVLTENKDSLSTGGLIYYTDSSASPDGKCLVSFNKLITTEMVNCFFYLTSSERYRLLKGLPEVWLYENIMNYFRNATGSQFFVITLSRILQQCPIPENGQPLSEINSRSSVLRTVRRMLSLCVKAGVIDATALTEEEIRSAGVSHPMLCDGTTVCNGSVIEHITYTTDKVGRKNNKIREVAWGFRITKELVEEVIQSNTYTKRRHQQTQNLGYAEEAHPEESGTHNG